MCLSTVYKIEKRPENEVLKNVMLIECKGGVVTLTDIMGRDIFKMSITFHHFIHINKFIEV